MAYKSDVAMKMYVGFYEYAKDKEDKFNTTLYMAWCLLAGMGAVKLWEIDWNSLKAKGVFETLTEKKGVFAMDEYVCELIGEEPAVDGLNEFNSFIKELVSPAEDIVENLRGEEYRAQMIKCTCAMYMVGISYELDRIKYQK